MDEDCDGFIDCEDPDCNIDPACLPAHFKCYAAKTKARTPKFEPQDVILRDQFETKNTTVLKPISLCNPVDKGGEGIKDPATYLTCYQIKDVRGQPRFEKRDVVIRNQFGDETLAVVKAKVLCVPSTKTELGPSSEEDPEEGDLAE